MLEHFHAKKRDVTAAIADLSTLATRVGAKSLGARVDADLVQKLQADRFHLVVVGEFNHGKTTFVNALLGRQVLPTGVTPTTACIHHLEFADEPSAAVVKQDGSRKEIPWDEVRRYVVGADGDPDSVKHLEVFFPADLLKERIVLVDTPGVNDLSLTRSDITYSYIPKSDAVLFLLDAGQPLKESERVFLQEKLLAQSRNKIVFVVTKRDIWDEAEEKEALAYIRNELTRICPNAPVFPVSAERALEGRRAESGLDELTAHLTRFLAEERGRILLDNALGESIEAAKLLGRGVDARRRAAQMTAEELTRRIEKLEVDLAGQAKTIEERRSAIREEVAAIKAWVRRDLEHFADDVAKQIPPMVDGASADEIRTHLGPFLERTFVEFAQKESKEVAGALETLAEKTIALVRDDAHEAAKQLGASLGGDVKAPTVEVDTLKYDVGVVALFSLGFGMLFTNLLLGGMLTAAAPLLAIYVKSRVEKETREKARELAPKVVREAATKLGPKLEQMIEDFAGRLDTWVVTAGEEMFRQVIEILRAARTDRESGVSSIAQSIAICDAHADDLEKARKKLEDLRSDLWGGAPPATDAGLSPTPPPARRRAEGRARGGHVRRGLIPGSARPRRARGPLPRPAGGRDGGRGACDTPGVQLDFGAREVAVKLVYYGPALSGKTTNLQALHDRMGAEAGGRLMTLDTRDDRTLFFDLLPLTVRSRDGSGSLRVKLFTVPGQPIHAQTRKMVLQGADGVAFVADSQASETQHNAAAFLDLRDNLKEHGVDMLRLPLVIQFNKRDLPSTRPQDELVELARRGREPVYQAVATRGQGVVETLIGLLDLTWRTLDATHGVSRAVGVCGEELLEAALRQLGDERPLAEVLGARIGGDVAARTPTPQPAPGRERDS